MSRLCLPTVGNLGGRKFAWKIYFVANFLHDSVGEASLLLCLPSWKISFDAGRKIASTIPAEGRRRMLLLRNRGGNLPAGIEGNLPSFAAVLLLCLPSWKIYFVNLPSSACRQGRQISSTIPKEKHPLPRKAGWKISFDAVLLLCLPSLPSCRRRTAAEDFLPCRQKIYFFLRTHAGKFLPYFVPPLPSSSCRKFACLQRKSGRKLPRSGRRSILCPPSCLLRQEAGGKLPPPAGGKFPPSLPSF